MIARIAAVALTALLIVAGGLWLAERQNNPGFMQASGQSAPETAPSPEEALAASFESLQGYAPVPFLSDAPMQSFEATEAVLEPGKAYRALVETNKGTMILELYQDDTPITVNNFAFLALHRYFEGIVFHRVLEDFMAQTGDPTGSGRGGPGYAFEDEIVEGLTHDAEGILSMANAGPNTNGSQFFITFTATPWLDGRHTVFGQVIEGLEVLGELQRIDPQSPEAIVQPDSTLAALSEQGITLAGDAETSVAAYLTENLGAMPSPGQTFSIDGYTGVMGLVGGEPAFGFFPRPDYIEQVVIFERPAE